MSAHLRIIALVLAVSLCLPSVPVSAYSGSCQRPCSYGCDSCGDAYRCGCYASCMRPLVILTGVALITAVIVLLRDANNDHNH